MNDADAGLPAVPSDDEPPPIYGKQLRAETALLPVGDLAFEEAVRAFNANLVLGTEAADLFRGIVVAHREALAQRDAEIAALAKAADLEDDNHDLLGLSLVWIGGDELHEEFLSWYKPTQWLGMHRAVSAFLSMKLHAKETALEEARHCLRDALQCIGKVGLDLLNSERGAANDWPAGQEWDDLVPTSQSICRHRGAESLGLDYWRAAVAAEVPGAKEWVEWVARTGGPL